MPRNSSSCSTKPSAEPMAESLDPEAFNDFLDSKPGWIVLTTIAPDGYPHSVPSATSATATTSTAAASITRPRFATSSKTKVSLVIESGSTMSDIKGAMIQGTAIVRRDPASVLEIMRKAAAGARGRTSRPPNRTEARVGLHRCCDRAPNLLGLRQLNHPVASAQRDLDDRLKFLEARCRGQRP